MIAVKAPRNPIGLLTNVMYRFWFIVSILFRNRLFDAIYNVADIIVSYVWAGR